MHPSSTLCRAQEALQLERAASAVLDNVRDIALKAAKAWGLEAAAREKAEAARDVFLQKRLSGLNSLDEEEELEELASFSENPDRGLTD